jgi:hypothetical protein
VTGAIFRMRMSPIMRWRSGVIDNPGEGERVKRKVGKPLRRNPEARELARNPLFRPRTTKSADQAMAQANRWSRRGKHRGKPVTENE